jgi:hypothetical protein
MTFNPMSVEASAPMDELDSEWRRKGATLSDNTAREEFGLTQDEIVRGIRAGTLQYREGSIYGNPWLRLLRREVEALVRNKHGHHYLKDRQVEGRAGAHHSRTEAAQDPDRSVGRAEVRAARRPLMGDN